MPLYIDLETFSSVDLRKSNVYRYVEAPDFTVLMCAWARDDEPTRLAVGEAEVRAIPGLFDPAVEKVAHNAAFERVVLSALNGSMLDPEAFTDTQALAAEAGLPQKLDTLAKALGAEEKDSAGTRLINLFSKPYRGTRVLPHEKPEQWAEFCAYCVQDVDTLRDVHRRLPDWPTTREREVYMVDQRINDRGIAVDLDLARAAVAADQANHAEHRAEVTSLTGVKNPGSVQQLSAWLTEAGVDLPDLRAETVRRALEGDLPDDARRVLELRQQLALSASKKFTAALLNTCDDGRVRGSFRFFGAHTGRWAGRGIQLQNLPRAAVSNPEAHIVDLKLGASTDAETLKALVRPMLTGPFTVVDYSAIEARVLAWLAGEQWVLEAFAAGRDIYVETGKQMGGLDRAEGKVATLACGYGGSVNAMRIMDLAGKLSDDDGDVLRLVHLWRRASPRIVRLWSALEEGFRAPTRVGRFLRVEHDRDTRRIVLPSGRAIVYHGVRWERYTAMVDGVPVPKQGFRFDNPTDPTNRRMRIGTWGGKLAENVTQAVARDLLAEALVRLDRAGVRVVGHVHDEVLVEGGSVEQVADLMCALPDWAEGLPLAAEGYVTERYRKG